ncbi:MAG: OmpA family protein [Deltaproteobacteria bacterium]|nr:OmpA family protein [Deltaproteobacteria bacterium]
MKPLTDKIIDQDSFIPDHAKIEETLAAISDDSDPEDSGSVRLDTHPEFRSKSTPSYGFQIHPELTNAADDEMDDVFYNSRIVKSSRWAVPWADLMMFMFILFAVMFIFHSANKSSSNKERGGFERMTDVAGIDQETGTGLSVSSESSWQGNSLYDGGIEQDEGRDTDIDLAERISHKGENSARRTINLPDKGTFSNMALEKDNAIRIILTSDLLFDTGKADLKPEAENRLRELSPIIGKSPYMVNVVGHTDNVPVNTERFPSNWELSATRACVVGRFLMEKMGIGTERFYISGHSHFQSVRPNDTPENRAANRRVEIIVTRERPRGI